MRDGRRVVITGVGAVSALGGTPESLWSALLNGESGVAKAQFPSSSGIPATIGGEVGVVSRDLPDRDRRIASLAIDTALASSPCDSGSCGFLWSTGLDTFQIEPAGPSQRSAGSCFGDLASRFGRPRLMIASACASSTQAVGEAYRLIRNGRADRCVAGGSSVMLTPFYAIGFAGLQAIAVEREGQPAACRPFDRRRSGFALADGAAALVLETVDGARRRGASVLAEVVGFGMSQDGFDLNRPCDDGAGAELAMRRALDDAELVPETIDAVNAHATGTLLGDLAEVAALQRLLGPKCEHTPVSGIKGAIGHAMAAAGALETIVAAYTCRTGIVPPTAGLEEPGIGCELDHVMGRSRAVDARVVLSTSFGMGGQNAALLLKRASA